MGSPILFDTDEGPPTDADFLRMLGHPVLVCAGPEAGAPCPIMMGANCEVLEAAHGIVFQLDLDRPSHRQVLSLYKQIVGNDVPIRVVIRPDQVGKYERLLEGLMVVVHHPAVSV